MQDASGSSMQNASAAQVADVLAVSHVENDE
jgi:hypothetical protein